MPRKVWNQRTVTPWGTVVRTCVQIYAAKMSWNRTLSVSLFVHSVWKLRASNSSYGVVLWWQELRFIFICSLNNYEGHKFIQKCIRIRLSVFLQVSYDLKATFCTKLTQLNVKIAVEFKFPKWNAGKAIDDKTTFFTTASAKLSGDLLYLIMHCILFVIHD